MTAPREHADDKTGQAVTDVLPCPFCGNTEGFYVEEGSTFRWRVISCRNCGEGTEVRHKNNSDEPDSYIADWNAAAPYPAMLRKELDTLRAQLAEAQDALQAAQRLFKEALPKFNWGASFLDANAIQVLNEVPAKVNAAIRAAKGESVERA